MKQLIFAIFFVNLLPSCGNEQEVKDNPYELKIIQVNKDNPIITEGFLLLESAIHLGFCENCIVGEVEKILVDDSGYYVLDNLITKSLTNFSLEGKYIFRIESPGDGLGKYVLPFVIPTFITHLNPLPFVLLAIVNL